MRHLRRISFAIPAVLLVAACSSTDPHAMYRINFSAMTGSAGASASPGIMADLIVTGSGGSVRITSAKMELSRIQLASDSTCSGDEDDQDDVDDPNEEHA